MYSSPGEEPRDAAHPLVPQIVPTVQGGASAEDSCAPEVSVQEESLPDFVLVASDLHLGERRLRGRKRRLPAETSQGEDAAFERWLMHYLPRAREGALLVLNGDTLDFTRVVRVPRTPSDFQIWADNLRDEMRDRATRRSVSARERRFGLDTNSCKSVWKLHVIVESHPLVFRAMARWIAEGGQLLLVKGNHDLELHWSEVMSAFRGVLERLAQCEYGARRDIANAVHFVDDQVTLGNLWIEHGHRWEHRTAVYGSATAGRDNDELNVPTGFFMARYFVNSFERTLESLRETSFRLRTAFVGSVAGVLGVATRFHTEGGLLSEPTAIAACLGAGFPMLFPRFATSMRTLLERRMTASSTANVLAGAREVLLNTFGWSREGIPSYAIMGHSHVQEVHRLPAAAGHGFYLNPGAWKPATKRKREASDAHDCYRFISFELIAQECYTHAAMLWDDVAGAARLAPLADAGAA